MGCRRCGQRPLASRGLVRPWDRLAKVADTCSELELIHEDALHRGDVQRSQIRWQDVRSSSLLVDTTSRWYGYETQNPDWLHNGKALEHI